MVRERVCKGVFPGTAGTLPVLLVFIALLLPYFASAAESTPASEKQAPRLHLFWGRGCPHCEEEKAFLETLKRKYPALEIREHEVWYDVRNKELFQRVMKSISRQAGVPTTVVGKKLFIGFNETTGRSIDEAVGSCLKQGCPDVIQSMIQSGEGQAHEVSGKVKLPLLGEVDPETLSLPILTAVIAALDSFNPCAFFVLLFLLSMLIHAHSRRKMLLIGFIFVFFSGLIYFLFMAAWLNLFLIIGGLTVITTSAGIIALLVASLNIKDFFFFKKGVSLVIPEKAKPRLFERMRNLLKSSSLPAMLGGTIVLAVSANAYELLCTAGFPLVYTRALTLHKLPALHYYLYLAAYNVIYVVPLSIIVLVMTVTVGSRKLTEWQGRQLKLISGLMMFFLGLILLVNPALLNNAAASAGLLAGVLVISAVMIYATRKMRPEIAGE
jgi:glutaredoxin